MNASVQLTSSFSAGSLPADDMEQAMVEVRAAEKYMYSKYIFKVEW